MSGGGCRISSRTNAAPWTRPTSRTRRDCPARENSTVSFRVFPLNPVLFEAKEGPSSESLEKTQVSRIFNLQQENAKIKMSRKG